MAQKPFAQRVSLAVQDAIYKVADDLTTIVDETLEAFEDAAARVEEKVTPVHNIVVNGAVDPEKVTEQIVNLFGGKSAEQAPSETGGSDVEVVPLSLRDTLGVVYDYMYENNLVPKHLQAFSKDQVLASYKIVLVKNFLEHTHQDTTGFKVRYTRA